MNKRTRDPYSEKEWTGYARAGEKYADEFLIYPLEKLFCGLKVVYVESAASKERTFRHSKISVKS